MTPTTARPKPDNKQLHTDAARLVVDIVGGSKPYLWIGDADGDYLDSIPVERIVRALGRVKGGKWSARVSEAGR